MSDSNAAGSGPLDPHDSSDGDPYLRGLYEVTSSPSLAFEEKLDALFELGRDRFGLEFGAIASIDPATDRWEVEHASGDHPRVGVGTRADLSETYCRLVADEADPVAVTDPVAAGFESALCYREFGVRSYLGTRLELDDQPDRTFFFVSGDVRDREFPAGDRTFLHLMGEWLRKEFERRRHEERLERQTKRLESFASMLAHELRNPLQIAEIYLQSAVEGDEGAAAEVERAHGRIEEMIDILLVTARGADATIDRVPVSLPDAAAGAWADEATGAATLVVDTDLTVRADQTHVRHLFQNLFRNAVEHGREDATVRVGSLPAASASEASSGFYVADDGPGIPTAEREDVFEAGYTTDADGTGLGLTFTAQLAETYDWDVRVRESESGGARFEFRDVDVVTGE